MKGGILSKIYHILAELKHQIKIIIMINHNIIKDKQLKEIISALLIISLIIRLVFVIMFLPHDNYVWEDSIHYHTGAKNIIETGSFGLDAERNDRPFGLEPVYSIIISPFTILFEHEFLYIRIFQSLLFVISGLLFYKILRWFANNTFSLIGLIIYLFYPFYIYLPGMILPEGVYVPLLVSLVYFLLSYIRTRNIKNLYFLAVILAISIHLKITSLPLIGLVIVPLLIETTWRKKIITVLSMLFIIVSLSTPYAIRNYQTFGKVVLVRNYRGKHVSEAKLITERSELKYNIQRTFGNNPVKNIFKNTIAYLSPSLTKVESNNSFNKPIYYLISIVTTLPFLISLLLILFFRRDTYVLALMSVFLLYSTPYFILWGQTRYRLPIDFILFLFTIIIINNLFLKKKKYKSSIC